MNALPGERTSPLEERPRTFGFIASVLENPAKAPWVLALATALLLLPFLSRAFNIDEPLFIWAAAHIQAHPSNPYGFKVNWDNRAQPMSDITKNPPGASYYLALAATMFGWREVGLHFAFLVPAMAAVLGLYFLAGRMCHQPGLAALMMLAMPVFLLSSTTIMCDVMMLALWLWCLYAWLRGLEQRKHEWLALGALLATASALTKYFGIALIPLLGVYTICKRRRLDTALAWLLLTMAILAAYNMATRNLYGRGLLSDAGEYTQAARKLILLHASLTSKILVGLGFAGGGLVAPLLLIGVLKPARRTVIVGGIVLAFGAGLTAWVVLPKYAILHPAIASPSVVIQWIIYAAAGLVLLWLTVVDLKTNRDANSLLLCLWVAGTIVFACFINWSINGRSILPLAPAAAILLARRLEQVQSRQSDPTPPGFIALPLILSSVVALAITQADSDQANSARQVSRQIANARTSENSNLWFTGHWGFQVYMEAIGGKPVDCDHINFQVGDLMVIPSNNSNLVLPKEEWYDSAGKIPVQANRWLTTQNPLMCAGFYSSEFGPLPFAFGSVPAEQYEVVRFKIRHVWPDQPAGVDAQTSFTVPQ